MRADKEMEALVWSGPRNMEIQTTSVPDPAPGEVLLEVSVAGICGSELSGYLGQNSLRKPPLIMGHEAAGRIVQIQTQARTDGSTLADGSLAQVGMRVTFNPLIVCGLCDRCRAGSTNLCRNRRIALVPLLVLCRFQRLNAGLCPMISRWKQVHSRSRLPVR